MNECALTMHITFQNFELTEITDKTPTSKEYYENEQTTNVST